MSPGLVRKDNQEEWLAVALRTLEAGNLAASEIVCREILDMDPRNTTALNALGLIACRVGALEHAASYFTEAVRSDPTNTKARSNLDLLAHTARSQERGNSTQRYLVIKSWGSGFWSDVSHVLGALLLAEITERIPVVHWGKNSLFSEGSDEDAFRFYFQPASNVTLADLASLKQPTFFPPKWNAANLAQDNIMKWNGPWSRMAALFFLARSETIAVSDFYIGAVNVASWIPGWHPLHGRTLDEIYRYLVDKFLHPQSAVQTAAEHFVCSRLNSGPFVAIHIRGSDKMAENQSARAVHRDSLSALNTIDPTWPIFLLTDDARWKAQFEAMYGKRVHTTNCQRTNSSTGVHFLPSIDRVKAGQEVMIDTYVALRANRFIGDGKSNVSAMVSLMKEWQPGDCTLFLDSLLRERNIILYAP
jgi:protein O-GlcNAc transferase